MLSARTVFVLGAGASEPYGFPTGARLRRDLLISLIPQVREPRPHYISIYECMLDMGFKQDHIEAFRVALAESGRTSVDTFLEHRPEYVDLGKAAMAAALMPQETHACLFNMDVGGGENWYEYLFNKLNTKFEELDRNNVAFLTFNYDRSLEHYLITSICNAYGKSYAEALRKIEKFRITHLYGDLGPLSVDDERRWRDPPPLSSDRISTAAKRIRIMHGDVGDQEFAVGRKFLSEAEVICFLGFGFHPTNIHRLLEGTARQSNVRTIASGFGLLHAERDSTARIVGRYLPLNLLGDPGHKVLYFLRQHFEWW